MLPMAVLVVLAGVVALLGWLRPGLPPSVPPLARPDRPGGGRRRGPDHLPCPGAHGGRRPDRLCGGGGRRPVRHLRGAPALWNRSPGHPGERCGSAASRLPVARLQRPGAHRHRGRHRPRGTMGDGDAGGRPRPPGHQPGRDGRAGEDRRGPRRGRRSAPLVAAGVALALLLYGLSIVYGATGSTDLAATRGQFVHSAPLEGSGAGPHPARSRLPGRGAPPAPAGCSRWRRRAAGRWRARWSAWPPLLAASPWSG